MLSVAPAGSGPRDGACIVTVRGPHVGCSIFVSFDPCQAFSSTLLHILVCEFFHKSIFARHVSRETIRQSAISYAGYGAGCVYCIQDTVRARLAYATYTCGIRLVSFTYTVCIHDLFVVNSPLPVRPIACETFHNLALTPSVQPGSDNV